MLIRRLIASDAAPFQALRLLALRESPTAFGSSHEEEYATPLSIIEGYLAPDSGRNMFGAFVDGELIGMVAIGREAGHKSRHKGYIRAMYVGAPQRGMGAGKKLLEQALAFAATLNGLHHITLTVTADNASAIAMYQSAGFKVFGHEPGGLLVEDVLYDVTHMVRISKRPS
jgi:RimJ/RimL family protein N-acetyltransferase